MNIKNDVLDLLDYPDHLTGDIEKLICELGEALENLELEQLPIYLKKAELLGYTFDWDLSYTVIDLHPTNIIEYDRLFNLLMID